MFFSKALIKAKDEQIATLKEEVAFLRNFIQPVNTQHATAIVAEANMAIEGRHEDASPDPTLEELKKAFEIESERNRLLSGTY